MGYDDKDIARIKVSFFVSLLVLSPTVIIGGIVASALGESWGWVITVPGVLFFLIALPGFLYSRRELRKYQ